MNNELIVKEKLYILKVRNVDNTEIIYKFSSKLELEKALGFRKPKYIYGTDINNIKVLCDNLNDIIEIYSKEEYNITSSEQDELDYKHKCKEFALNPAIIISEKEFNRINEDIKNNKQVLDKIKERASDMMKHSTFNGKPWTMK